MSRFKSSLPRLGAPSRIATATLTPSVRPAPAPRVPLQVSPPKVGGGAIRASLGVMQRIGFIGLWIFVFSLAALVNETSQQLLGAKPYSTTLAGPVMAVGLLISGNIFRGIRTTSGVLWLIMIVAMTAGIPFSVWRSDSLAQWLQYTVKIYPLLFFICAAAVTVAHCEKLLYAQIIAGGVVLVLTTLLGHTLDGRLSMGTGTLMNPNALSLQLILAACSFVYLLYMGRGAHYTALGLLGMFICAALVFRTGSRGGFLAVIGAIVAVYFTIRQASTKFKMLALLGVLGLSAIVAAAANPIAFKRLTDIAVADRSPADSQDVLFANSSQMAREELLRYAVDLTLTHPLLGVGIGQFPVAVDNGAREKGQKSSWNGTHNSYLQVSSECGIPAAICYILVILISIRTSRKLYREFSLRPGEEKLAGIALTLFTALVSLAIAEFFFHLAYTYYVPVFCGMTLALNAAAANRRELTR